MKKIKQLLVLGMLAFGMLMPVLTTGVIGAVGEVDSAKNSACKGTGGGEVDGAGNPVNPCDGTASTTVGSIVSTIVDILTWIVGIMAVIMIVFAGFNFITSNGDSSKVQRARSSLIYALVGVAVVVSAQVLVNFVVGNV